MQFVLVPVYQEASPEIVNQTYGSTLERNLVLTVIIEIQRIYIFLFASFLLTSMMIYVASLKKMKHFASFPSKELKNSFNLSFQ